MPADDDTQKVLLQDAQAEILEKVEEDENAGEDHSDHDELQGNDGGKLSGNPTAYRKLTTLIAIFAILLGFILSTYHATQTSKPKVIYASRYSKEHKFRPAASPIITETLKDGRIRIRGADPTMSAPPPPKQTTYTKPKRKRKTAKKKASSKHQKVS